MEMSQPARKPFTAICLVLAIVTFILYWPVRHDGFINLDDGSYITENAHVISGLSWSNVKWSFTHSRAGYWMPLTWISHMVDCQLFGLNAGPHHLVNVLFHIANTLLLFWWLNQMTGALWRGAFVAALFAWHPLRVESVAWACERKDILCAFFWMLTLIYYTKYVQAQASRSSSPGSHASMLPRVNVFYILALLMFACGLMSKPMVVTLPCVLLLIDIWPLQRLNPSTLPRLLIEKIPFFILSAAECAITCFAESSANAVSNETFLFRLTNALWGYMRYLGKTFWPFDLAVFYTLPSRVLIGPGIVAALVLGVCSIVCILLLRRRPYLFVGWFWFLGTLVPVIGLARVGGISVSDRYTYLPGIGFTILMTWVLADFFESRREKIIPAVAAVAILAACMVLTSIQISYWRNSITVFRHALAVTKDNYVACACLGQALDEAGDWTNALKFCQESVRLKSDYPPGQFFLGMAYWKMGDATQALPHLDTAARASPDNPGFQYNLGKFLSEHDKSAEAISYFNAALKDDPDFANAHNALGKTLLKQGNLPQAAAQLSQAVALEPDFADAQENLAVTLANQGQLDQAIVHFAKVAQLQPNDPDAWFNLGFAYLNDHQPAQATAQFSHELHLTPNTTKAHYRLAQALAQQNQWAQAVQEYRQTLRLTPDFLQAKKELDQILAAHPQLR
jgi:protein O-mannosyl-transferase